jgi:hypothetical protein
MEILNVNDKGFQSLEPVVIAAVDAHKIHGESNEPVSLGEIKVSSLENSVVLSSEKKPSDDPDFNP